MYTSTDVNTNLDILRLGDLQERTVTAIGSLSVVFEKYKSTDNDQYKSETIPAQAYYAPRGFQEVVRLSALSTGNIPGTHFC
jgi:hypothetical protein